MTSDFLVTVQDKPGAKKRFAVRTCKYESALSNLTGGPRTIEKLDLERAIWADQGVTDWKIVTDRLLTPVLIDNLDWLHQSAWRGDIYAEEAQQLKFIEAAVHAADGERKLSSVIRSISSAVGLAHRHGTSLFKYLVWNKFLITDLSEVRLDPTLPCPKLSISKDIPEYLNKREVA